MVPKKLASSNVVPNDTGDRDLILLTLQPYCPVSRGGAMRDASQILSFKILFLAVFLASLCLAPAIAQKRPEPPSPKYDLHTETKMKLTVEELKLPPKGSEKEVAHLLGKSGADSVDVYLCPKSFLDDMGVSFEKGDEIA